MFQSQHVEKMKKKAVYYATPNVTLATKDSVQCAGKAVLKISETMVFFVPNQNLMSEESVTRTKRIVKMIKIKSVKKMVFFGIRNAEKDIRPLAVVYAHLNANMTKLTSACLVLKRIMGEE